MVYLLKMVIFHGYVKQPDGIYNVWNGLLEPNLLKRKGIPIRIQLL